MLTQKVMLIVGLLGLNIIGSDAKAYLYAHIIFPPQEISIGPYQDILNSLPPEVTFTPGDLENTWSVTQDGMSFKVTEGLTADEDAFDSVQSEGSGPFSNWYTTSITRIPFWIVGPSNVPVGTPVTVDLTFSLYAHTDYTSADLNFAGSEAFTSVTEPDGTNKGIGAGWDSFTEFSQSVPGTYTKQITFTDKITLATTSLEQVYATGTGYSTITLLAQILTHSPAGSPGDGAYAYNDPMIQIDPLTPDAQDYQIVLPDSFAPVPEPSSGLLALSGLGVLALLIQRRKVGELSQG